MDHCAITANAFHNLADRYRAKYMDLTRYDESYREFCQTLKAGRARVLDAACGPGNASRYLMAHRPELDLLGIDLAPRMIELARAAVPSARFEVQDCRKLADLTQRFAGILCAFGLPYLSAEEAGGFIQAANHALEPGGALYLSTMLGREEASGFQPCSNGERVYITYHTEEQILRFLHQCRFEVLRQWRLPSPNEAPVVTTDLVVIARKPSTDL